VQVDVPKRGGLLLAIKARKLRKYDHWKRRGEGAILAVIELKWKGQQNV